MQNATKAYKESIRGIGRNRGYIKVSIGVINTEAQANVEVDKKTKLTYFSNPARVFDGYEVDKPYATGEHDWSKVDGSMYFLPPQDANMTLYDNGIVTNDLSGTIYISFKGVTGLDIKGLTIDFGECYPTDFTVQNDNVTRSYNGNDKSYFTTEDVFDGTSYLIITPIAMVNGQGRLRIYKFFCGIINSFTNKETRNFTLKEYVSSITESIPSVDMSLTVDNQNMYYSPDNPESALAYMEVGQEMRVQFGYDVTGNGDIEWLPPNRAYLKKWSADDVQAKFTATDRFDYLTDKYYKGRYNEVGISLYDLAIDVLADIGITDERRYSIDPYLKDVIVHNPMPVVKHSEALQIIANAGRCALYEDREGKIIHIQASFVPDMYASANNETEYSHVENVLIDDSKIAYAIHSNDFSVVDESILFMPKADEEYGNTGYISKSIWIQDTVEGTLVNSLAFRLGGYNKKVLAPDSGHWEGGDAPKITIDLEAAFVAYGLFIRFRNVAPKEFHVLTYNEGILVNDMLVTNPELEYITYDQFDLFNKMEIVFTKGYPNARITVDNVLIGSVTDYVLSRNHELTDYPVATRQNKIKTISIVRKNYIKSTEEIKELKTEELVLTPDNLIYTIDFSNASYDYSVEIEDNNSVTAEIVDYSDYFATIKFGGITAETVVKYILKGHEYIVQEMNYTVNHSDNGENKTWSNPLISDIQHAKDVEEWLASYYLGDVDYQIKWRGDPRVDANDLFYLELKSGDRPIIRAYQNELKFSGAWSGTIKARKVVL